MSLRLTLLAIGGSFVVSTLAVRLTVSLAKKAQFVCSANPITRDSRTDIAFGGGIPTILVIIAATSAIACTGMIHWRIPIALLVVLCLGIVDDVRHLKPVTKLIGQIASAVAYLSFIDLEAWTLPVALAFLVLSQNAWNLIDVMDGLLGWVGVVCCIGIAVVMFTGMHSADGLILTAMISAGSIGGFLVWNNYPARIYMGDSGSLAIGMLFGVLVVETFAIEKNRALIMLIPGAIPFFETAFLTIQRFLKGIPIYRGSADHFALRMRNSGFSVSQIIARAVAVGVALLILGCIAAISLFNSIVVIIIIVVILAGSVAAFRFLHGLSTWDSAQ